MTNANHLPDPTRIEPGRVPPSDLDAEGAILSWVITEPGDYDRCVAIGLTALHFYADSNRRIWESIQRLSESKQYIDVVEIAGDLRLLGRLDQIGGTPYLAQLAAQMPVEGKPGLLEQYCRTIIQHWRARQIISLCQVTGATLYHTAGVPSRQIIEEHEAQVWELAHDHREAGYEPAGFIAHRSLTDLAAALRDGKKLVGVTTGFDDLDKKTTGFHKSDFIIIAARPGIGKTSFSCSSVLQMTKPPRDGSLPEAVYFHSCEMPKDQIALRLVCSLAGLEFQRLRLGQLDHHAWDKLFSAAAELSKQPILIDDKPAVTVLELRSNIRKIKREIELGRIQASGLSVAYVDYLQLMTGEKGAGREREISSISQGLKNTAKTEQICMVALAQLNREVEKRGGKNGKRPMLSDLRESGSLEQDADAVWFLYREQYYDKEANDEAEVIIAKQRSGPTCTVTMVFDGETTTFRPLARGYEEMGNFADNGDPGAGMPEESYWNK